MAGSTGVVLTMGAIVLTNQVLVNNQPVQMRVVLAVGMAAIGLAMVEHLSPELGTGLAYMALATALVAPIGGQRSPLENILSYMGFAK